MGDLSPAVLATLPLLYVAWADGLLTPSQIDEIPRHVDAQPWIAEADKRQLAAWLDPRRPPSTTQYHRWMRAIRTAAQHVPEAGRRSLADLGVEIARVARPEARGSEEEGGALASDEARRALREIERTLGVVGPEVVRDLLRGRPPAAPDGHVPRFDVAAMTALLDGEHGALRDRMRVLLSDPVFGYDAHPPAMAVYREQVYERLRRLAEQALGALAFPEKYGGGGSIGQFITAFEMLAYGDLSLVVKFGVQFGLFGGSVQQLGTRRHHERYLGAIGRLDLPGGFAMSELGHGSNVRELETVARYDREEEEFVLNTPSNAARKEWIGNAAAHGQMVTVFAQLEIDGEHYGVHAFLVPIRDRAGDPLPRVRIADCGHKMGLNGVDNGRLWFDHVRIPRANLLDRFAQVEADGTYHSPIPSSTKRFFVMLSTLVGGRISVAAAAVSAAKVGLTIAVRYGERRRQFGPKDAPEVPILDYRTHQRRLLPLVANAYALHFAVRDLRQRFAREQGAARADETRAGETRADETAAHAVEGLAAGLKVFATENTTRTLQTARECCGGQGYLSVNRLPQLKADTDVFTTFEGDNTVLMLQVAKGLLSEFRQEFQDMNFFGTLRYLAGEARTRLQEQNPLVTRRADAEHLRSDAFQRSAFRQREHDLVQSAARRLRYRIDEGMDSYDAFIDVQDHLLTMAEAHVERVLLESFLDAARACPDEALRRPLALVADLFALCHLERHRGWYQEEGYMEGAKAKAIREQVNALCGEIRPMASDLVNAFAIPDACLAAPIALGETPGGAA